VIPNECYTRQTIQKSAFKHTLFVPPSHCNEALASKRIVPLSQPFANYGKTNAKASQNKVRKTSSNRAKTADKTLDVALSGDGETARKRKTNSCRAKRESEPGHTRSYKIRMLPTKEQKKAIKLAFAVCRYAYNWANSRVRNDKQPADYDILTVQYTKVLEECRAGNSDVLPNWASTSKVYRQIQNGAIRHLTAAYESAETNKINGNIRKYRVRYRSFRETKTEVIELPKKKNKGPLLEYEKCICLNKRNSRAYVRLGGHFADAGSILIEGRHHVIEKMVAEGVPIESGKILWNKELGTFHFIYLFSIPILPDPDPTFLTKRIVANDPGVIPFQAFYSPTSGEHGRLLDEENANLSKKCDIIDTLRSRLDKKKHGRLGKTKRQRRSMRKRLRRKYARERKRLTEWVRNAHYDCANFLLSKFDVIIQPKLNTKALTKNNENRKIGRKTARDMYTFSHAKYQQRLEIAAARYPGRHIIQGIEPGTSKTCTDCGEFKRKLNGQMTYECQKCGLIVDRQLAGARNNFFAAYGVAVGIGWDEKRG